VTASTPTQAPLSDGHGPDEGDNQIDATAEPDDETEWAQVRDPDEQPEQGAEGGDDEEVPEEQGRPRKEQRPGGPRGYRRGYDERQNTEEQRFDEKEHYRVRFLRAFLSRSRS
jgi:hypothetical protein